MAYPYALNTDLALPLDSTYNERTGPFYYGDTRFGVFTDYVSSPPRLEVWKSTNAGQTWTECDESNHPEIQNPFTPSVFSADTDGNRIYIHFLHKGSHPSASIAVFDMASQSWDTVYDGGPDVLGGDDPKFCVLDDGNGLLIWDGDQEEVNSNFYGRIWAVKINLSTGSWGVSFMLRQGFEQSYFNAALVAGTGGRGHVFYYDGNVFVAGSFVVRANNSESVDTEFWNDNTGTRSYFWGLPDKANAAGKVIFAFDLQSNTAPGTDEIYVTEATSADSPNWSTPALAYTLSFSSFSTDARTDFGSLSVAWRNPSDLPVLVWAELIITSGTQLRYFYKTKSATGTWSTRVLIYEAPGSVFPHQVTLSRVPNRIGAFFDYTPSPFSEYLVYYWELSGRKIGGMYTLGDSNEF